MKAIAALTLQIEDLALHIRTIRANVNRASKELEAGFGKRARRPFENSLRWRRYRDATDLQLIAEACLHDLRKALAMRMAPFRPGDQVVATLTQKGLPALEKRYGIWDIEPSTRGSYSYEAIWITKSGVLSKRFDIQPLLPERYSLQLCESPLSTDSAATLRWRREVCERFLDRAVNVGSLDDFEIQETGWSRHRSIKRRT